MHRTPPNKNKEYPPEVLTDDEVHALLEQCSTRTPTGLRNRALIAVLLAYSGAMDAFRHITLLQSAHLLPSHVGAVPAQL